MEYTVRPSRVADHEALIALFGGPKAAANTLQIPYEAPEARLQRLANPPPGHYSLVACTPEGEVVGLLGLTVNQRPRRSHVADLGMAVHDGWHRRGVGTALMAAACDLADRWLPVRRIELIVYIDNAPAIALYEQFGFAREGLLRQYALRDGGYIDAYAMARLRSGPEVLLPGADARS